MINQGKSALLETDLRDYQMDLIADIDDFDYEVEKEVFSELLDFWCSEAGIQTSSITERGHYSVLHTNGDVRFCIADLFARLKNPDISTDSRNRFILQVANELPHLDDGIEQGNVIDMADDICPDDSDSEDVMMSIAAKLVQNGS